MTHSAADDSIIAIGGSKKNTCRAHAVGHGFHIHHGIDVKQDASITRERCSFMKVSKSSAADPGMTHTGSSSVTDAKDAGLASLEY